MAFTWKPSDVLDNLANPFNVETPQEIFRSLEKMCFMLDIDMDLYGKVGALFSGKV